jgi:hypothetical protein
MMSAQTPAAAAAGIHDQHEVGAVLRHQPVRRLAACGGCGREYELQVGLALFVVPTWASLCDDCGREHAGELQQVLDFVRGDIWPRLRAARPSLGEWLEVFAILETLRSGYRRTA